MNRTLFHIAIASGLLSLCLLAFTGPARAQDDALIADDGTYLGCVSCSEFHPDSVRNPYGRYGSRFSPDSINNSYGRYGSEFSPLSARNRYTQTAPTVHSRHTYPEGALSANRFHTNHLSLTNRLLWDEVNEDLAIIPEDVEDSDDED